MWSARSSSIVVCCGRVTLLWTVGVKLCFFTFNPDLSLCLLNCLVTLRLVRLTSDLFVSLAFWWLHCDSTWLKAVEASLFLISDCLKKKITTKGYRLPRRMLGCFLSASPTHRVDLQGVYRWTLGECWWKFFDGWSRLKSDFIASSSMVLQSNDLTLSTDDTKLLTPKNDR